MIDQARTRRSLAPQPRQLGRNRMRRLEDLRGPLTKLFGVAFAADRKPPDRDTVHPLDPGVELVAPGDVVGRAGRQNLALGVSREVLSDIPGMQLGAAVQLGAVALDDERDLQGSSPTGDRRQEKPEGFAVVRFIFGSPMCLLRATASGPGRLTLFGIGRRPCYEKCATSRSR